MSIPKDKLQELLEMGFNQAQVQELWPKYQSTNRIADFLLQTQNMNSPPIKQPMETENEQIKKAIKLSTESFLQNKEIRKESIPVGLANIGNSCYFNCIIQIYFNNHKFVDFILNVNLNERMVNNILIDQSKQLINELRQLFYRMIASKQQALDPSKVIKSILADDCQPVHSGNQYDAGEFNQIFLQRISNAISETTQDQLNTHLALLCSGETSSYIELENQKYHQPKEKFTMIILEPKYGELLQAMIGYCQQRINDFQHGNNVFNNIPKYTIFQRLPKVLFIQIQRTFYNKLTNQTEKDNTQFRFSPQIDLSIFLDEAKIKGFSDQIYNQTEDINRLKQKQQKQNYWIDNRDIIKSLETSLEYLRQLPIKEESIRAAETVLEKQIQSIKSQKTNYQNQIANLENQILLKSNNMTMSSGNHRYWLQGIIMHSGGANLGHYFCFIYDFQKKVWRRYNDSIVTEVPENDVFEQANGQGNSSAFCLTYVNEEFYQEYQKEQPIQSYLYPENINIKYDRYFNMIPQSVREQIIRENQNNQISLINKNNVNQSQIHKINSKQGEINYQVLVSQCLSYYKKYSQLFDSLEVSKKNYGFSYINLRDVAFFARQVYPRYIQIIFCDLIAVSEYQQFIIGSPNLDKLQRYLETNDTQNLRIIPSIGEEYPDEQQLKQEFKIYRSIFLALEKIINTIQTNITECIQILTYIRIIQQPNFNKFDDLLIDITLFLSLILLLQINRSNNNQKIIQLECLQQLHLVYCHQYIDQICRWLQEIQYTPANSQVSVYIDNFINYEKRQSFIKPDFSELRQKYQNSFIDSSFQLIGNVSSIDEQLEMIKKYLHIKQSQEFYKINQFQKKCIERNGSSILELIQ
ncbi:hypothetical protein pb186bvf_018122 [Paramecium bursaria]